MGSHSARVSMSSGLNFQSLSGLSSRWSSRSLDSSLEMCRKHLTTVVPSATRRSSKRLMVAVAPRPGAAVDELADPHHDDVLVVRAVEDAEHPRLRARACGCARGSRAQLLLGGRLEGRDVTPAGRPAPTTWRTVPPLPEVSMPCRTSRIRRVPARAALGEEPLLEVGEPRPEQLERLLAVCLVAVEARCGPGVHAARSTGPWGSRSRSVTRMLEPRALRVAFSEVLPLGDMVVIVAEVARLCPGPAGYGRSP